jgi:hypothetical protein
VKRFKHSSIALLVGLFVISGSALWQDNRAESLQDQPAQKVAIAGEFVRQAVNDEGVVVVGFRSASSSVGQEWMLLEVAMTTMRGHIARITRENLSITTPDEQLIPLATQEEYAKAGYLRALNERANMQNDSVGYLPAEASRPCRIGFFSDPRTRLMAYDGVELSHQRGCFGRLYFKIPQKIEYGDYALNVKFEGSVIRVPFKIMTKEEQKEFRKKWKEMEKERKEKKNEEKKK